MTVPKTEKLYSALSRKDLWRDFAHDRRKRLRAAADQTRISEGRISS